MNAYLAEFLGTAILILFGGGVCANVNLKRSAGNGADWIVIAFGWGLAVTMGWAFMLLERFLVHI